ncbi:acyl-CoA reductase-like NAD-dependent aldehyde dehydrogenase [Paraburkholderia sp. WC7.3g]
MNTALRDHPAFRAEALRLGGERATRARTLDVFERSQILERAAVLLRERFEPASDLISLESGLSKQDSRYEGGRVADVFRFASIEALRDDAQRFSCRSDAAWQKASRVLAARAARGRDRRDHTI